MLILLLCLVTLARAETGVPLPAFLAERVLFTVVGVLVDEEVCAAILDGLRLMLVGVRLSDDEDVEGGFLGDEVVVDIVSK